MGRFALLIGLAGCVLAPALVASAGCRREASMSEQPFDEAVPVMAEAVRLQSVRATVAGAGTVVAAAAGDWTVYAAETGHILELPRREGDPVEPGDVLVRFEYGTTAVDVASREMEVRLAETRLDAARAEAAKMSGLYDRGFTARNDYEAAASAVTAAELDLARARGQLEAVREASGRAVVTARFPGVVARLFHVEGDLVNGSTMDPVLRVVDPSRLEVLMAISVQELAQIQVGQPATILSASGAEAGTVLARPASDPTATTPQDIRLGFAEPTSLAMDAPVQVEILVAEHANVLAVPAAALLEDLDGGWAVMVVGDDEMAHRRQVRTGLSAGGRVEIVSGLAPGERVVIRDPADLADGTPVLSNR